MVDYLVDTPDGSVGVLDGWARDEHGRPRTLIVAQGWFGRRRFEVPLEALVGIDHEGRRIILARGAVPLEPKGPLQRLVELGQSRPVEDAAGALPRSRASLRALSQVQSGSGATRFPRLLWFGASNLSAPGAWSFGWMSFAVASLSSVTAVAGPKRAPFCRSLT